MCFTFVFLFKDSINTLPHTFELLLQMFMMVTNLISIEIDGGHLFPEGNEAALTNFVWYDFIEASDHFFDLFLLCWKLL